MLTFIVHVSNDMIQLAVSLAGVSEGTHPGVLESPCVHSVTALLTITSVSSKVAPSTSTAWRATSRKPALHLPAPGAEAKAAQARLPLPAHAC